MKSKARVNSRELFIHSPIEIVIEAFTKLIAMGADEDEAEVQDGNSDEIIDIL